jgi:aldehyde:ferredoxin oxidoreductase
MDYYGYAGKQLYVNLTDGEIETRSLDLDMAIKFLGGMGIQMRILYDLLEPEIDPFSPENPIIVGSGPLVGTGAPGTPRVMATLKYPETEAIGSGGGAMKFGFMLKLAGYDHIIITGKADKPVYLKIVDDDVKICDARHLWGKDIVETTKCLWDAHGDCGVIAMGQAGEHNSRLGLAFCDLGSTLGRGGFAGVMGSKNLKALVSRGSGSVKVADPERFNRARESLFARAKRYAYHDNIVRYGIMENWVNYRAQFMYGKNRTQVIDPRRIDEELGFEAYKKLGKSAFGCPSCFIADKEIVEIPFGRFKGLKWSTTSYLGAAVIGVRLGLKDVGEAIKLGDVTDRYGIDQSSFSDLLDFVFTLHEEGIISKSDVGDMPLKRGDTDIILALVEKTALRKGFGEVLADSWEGIKETFGEDLIKTRTAVIKGRQGVWEPRMSGLGTNEFAQLTYPRAPNAESGGSGLYALNQPIESVKRHAERMGMSKEVIDKCFDSPLKINIGRFVTSSEHWLALFNSLGICNRHVNNRFYHIDIISELYSAATGINLSPQELIKHSERVWNLFKMINVREGFSKKDDEPPDVWFQPMVNPEGKEVHMTDYYKTRRLTREDVEQWLRDYYDERGWDTKTGIPTSEKLVELGLEKMISRLQEKQ